MIDIICVTKVNIIYYEKKILTLCNQRNTNQLDLAILLRPYEPRHSPDVQRSNDNVRRLVGIQSKHGTQLIL